MCHDRADDKKVMMMGWGCSAAYRGVELNRGDLCFVHCGANFFETGKDFEQSADVNFQKSIDNREELWYNTELVRTANARPSPYRVKFIDAV